jgi:polysaccharide biosynthesis protein PslA
MTSSIDAFVGPARKARSSNRISLQRCVAVFLIFDVLAIAGLGLLTTAIGAGYERYPFEVVDNQALAIGFALFLFILLSCSANAYKTQYILDRKYSVRRLIAALLFTFATLATLGVASKASQGYSHVWFFAWLALTCAILPIVRFAVLAHIRDRLDNKGAFVFRAFSIGVFSEPLSSEEIALRTKNLVKTAFTMRLDDFGVLAGLSDKIVRGDIDRIYFVVPWLTMPIALKHLQYLRNFSTEVFIIPESDWTFSNQLDVSTFGNRLSLTAVNRPIDGWDLWFKRTLDVIIAMTTIVLFSLVILGVAISIRLESPGPILFRQKRTGFNGSIFELWKFRSMYSEQTDPDAACQTAKRDPRVTRVGRFIRRTSLDELPQMFNVLQGKMSIVGPRPHALKTQAGGQPLQELVASYAARHRVKPGITGWAQIKGLRGELDSPEKLEKRVKYDIEYIENWSMWLDLKIIIRTVKLVVYDPAAY